MVESILTELWNGNINPCVRFGEKHLEINELNDLMVKKQGEVIGLIGRGTSRGSGKV